MEDEAIYMGLTLDYFWSLNPKQYKKHCDVYRQKQETDVLIKDRLNHILGQYIGIAINDGKNYPKKPLLDTTERTETTPQQTVDEMEKMARRNTLFMGGVIKDDNRSTGSAGNS